MQSIDSYYRQPTGFFPLAVSYYAPFRVTPEPLFVACSSKMQILFLHRGQVEVFLDGHQHLLEPGDIFILLPHQIYSLRTTTMETRYVRLLFSKELICPQPGHFFEEDFVGPLFEGRLKLPQWIRPGDPLHPELSAQLQRVDWEKEELPGYQAELFLVVLSLCFALFRHSRPLTRWETAQFEAQRTLRLCLEYMRTHYSETITLHQLAQLARLHPNYLSAFFKAHTGKTVFAHLTRLRLYEGAKLLRGSGLTVAQIAAKVGYGQFSNPFTRQFKATYGCTPTAYRKLFHTK